ncbi:unnamed protein product [Camellia sinensis]
MAKRFDSQEFDNSVNNNSRFVSFHSHFLRQMENQVEPCLEIRRRKRLPSFAKIYGSYDAVLNNPNVDAVYIPLPTSLHIRWVVLVAEKKKHLLLKKPNHIRYEIRQKRADAKRALKDLLFSSGSSKITFQDHFPKLDGTTSWNTEHADHSDISGKRSRSNTSTRHSSKAQHKRMKRKARQESFSDDFDGHHETVFQATFGNRWYTWSFKSWEESNFHTSTNGFEWRGHPKWNYSRNREWQNASDIESDDESCIIGSSSERAILGLPSRGPLKIEDVKNATPCSFRLSALKWHPDKHQGSSQGNGRREIQTLCRCIQITMQCTLLGLNYLVTRLAKKRAAEGMAGSKSHKHHQPPTKKRVILGELTNLSNEPATRDLGSEPKKPKSRAAKKVKKAVTTSTTTTKDIDSKSEDPQICGADVSEIYEYLHNMEKEAKRRPLPDYIEKVQKDVSPNMRAILVDWLVEVAEEYKLLSDTLHLSISHMDRFFDGKFKE